jgi:hypothetical protein
VADVVSEPVIDSRRVESLVREFNRYAPLYAPDLNIADPQGAGPALMRIAAQLAEAVLVRIARAPKKHFIAFLDRLGINRLPARPARTAVTFRLASGLTTAVLVPRGTRVNAPGENDDIPFETTGEMLAIPGALAAAYGVDPSRDAIFRHPPDFLKQEIRTASELVYEVQAFAAAGSKRLQLNHVTELKPGSFIQVAPGDQYVIENMADGSIVILRTPLLRDVAAQTAVLPIRDFEVFRGIDLQEHVLYLGHPDLFTIKKEATITIGFGLDESIDGLGPFDLGWEFWTEVEHPSGDKEELWFPLEVKTDGTSGLSSSGSVVLTKPLDVEIKERVVGGVKSRWIRARLRDKLTDPIRPLPSVDELTLAVKALPDEGIPADQGFHNATPLDLAADSAGGFLPFGAEPRQFDQFYIASEEAFSKHGAEVRLAFTLDLQTLASPSIVAAGSDLFVYSIGLRRNLYQLNLVTGDWTVFTSTAEEPILERPQGSRFVPVEDSSPSAVSDAAHTLIFVNSADGLAAEDPPNRLWVHVRGGLPSPWKDLGAPGPTPPRILFSPAAILKPSNWNPPSFDTTQFARVFVVAGDKQLYSRGVDDAGGAPGPWMAHGLPPDVAALNSPAFATATDDRILVFVNGEGDVHRFTLNKDGTSEWVSLKQRLLHFRAVSRPFAVPYGPGSAAKVFVFGVEEGSDRPKLFECDADPAASVNGEFLWIDLGSPTQEKSIQEEPIDERPEARAPAGYIERPGNSVANEGKHIFLRGADERLHELIDPEEPGEAPRWRRRSRDGEPPLRDTPAVHASRPAGPETTTLRVLAATSANSLIAWTFEVTDDDVPATAARLAVQLGNEASSADDRYLNQPFDIASGPGSSPANNDVTAYDGVLKIVRLTAQLNSLPDENSECTIGGDPVGRARNGADRLFALHPRRTDTRRGAIIELRLDGDLVEPEFYSRLTGVVSIDPALGASATYTLYAEVLEGRREYGPLDDRSSVPSLSWEYWNGRGWVSLPVAADTTRNLLSSGEVTFEVPDAIERTEVAGQDSFWIRARLVGGDYGRETFKLVNNVVVSEKSTLRPPTVTRLRIRYEIAAVPPTACLTFNNLDYLDQTAAAKTGGGHFRPFDRLERVNDRSLSLFLGFDRSFRTGPVRLFIDAAEREIDERTPPEFEWRFRKDRQWKELDVDDGSFGLTRPGILTLVASEALTRESRFGEALFWIRGSLRTDRGGVYPNPLLRGLFLNTVWADQGETITDEIAGSSNGEANQTFTLQQPNVLDGEDVRIREPLSAEEREQIERERGEDSVIERDDLVGTWVRWNETTVLFDAGPDDRVYVFDRASGELQFGDGVHGRIPPADVDNIRVFRYRTGGGAAGNVEAGSINALGTALAGIESVFNPTPAGGGSDTADTEAMLTLGPRRISHRDRAISAEDFEELAVEASRQVAKARCLVATKLTPGGSIPPKPCDPAVRHEAQGALGWVTLIIVPDTADRRPCPSLELRRTVVAHLRRRAPGVLAASDRIVVRPPDYVEVGIEAEIFVKSLEKAAAVEADARKRLETLLHPLRGGPDGKGWEFGRSIWKSDVLSELHRIADVDRVENLLFRAGSRSDPERVDIGPNELLSSGDHRLLIKKA